MSLLASPPWRLSPACAAATPHGPQGRGEAQLPTQVSVCAPLPVLFGMKPLHASPANNAAIPAFLPKLSPVPSHLGRSSFC